MQKKRLRAGCDPKSDEALAKSVEPGSVSLSPREHYGLLVAYYRVNGLFPAGFAPGKDKPNPNDLAAALGASSHHAWSWPEEHAGWS
jgi:hypothetical protein